jgi:Aldo/keto reductase family
VDHVTLGRSGLKISRACLGAMNFGTAGGFGIDDAQARPIIDAYLDSEHNFLDTAENYNHGQSEEIVGRAVRSRRDAVVIATKGFVPKDRAPTTAGCPGSTSPEPSTRACVGWHRLRRPLQCHHPDPDTPIEETMATLDGFVRAGKVRYLGCSNFTAGQIVEAQWATQRLGATPLVSLQATSRWRAARISCGSPSRPGCLTSCSSTWFPCCWAAASACLTGWGRRPSGWTAWGVVQAPRVTYLSYASGGKRPGSLNDAEKNRRRT